MEVHPELDLKSLADGNGVEWDRLMYSYSDMVLDQAWRILKDYHSAQDVHQDVFAKLWKQKRVFKELRSVKGYLICVTRNMALSFRRNACKEQTTYVLTEHLEMICLAEGDEPERILENSQMQEAIEIIHSRLTPAQKRVFEDYIDDPDPDTSIRKRSKRLECSSQNIRSVTERIRDNNQYNLIVRERHDLR